MHDPTEFVLNATKSNKQPDFVPIRGMGVAVSRIRIGLFVSIPHILNYES